MTPEQCFSQLQSTYDIIGHIDLDQLLSVPVYERSSWINKRLLDLYQSEYQNNQRIVAVLKNNLTTFVVNDILQELQRQLNAVDISNFFVILATPESAETRRILAWVAENISADPVPMSLVMYDAPDQPYDYNSSRPLKIKLENFL
jgi:hypothetical protein